MKERIIRELIGEKVLITTNLKCSVLEGTIDKEITNKPFKENTMIYYRDNKNILCGIEFKHIINVVKVEA